MVQWLRTVADLLADLSLILSSALPVSVAPGHLTPPLAFAGTLMHA